MSTLGNRLKESAALSSIRESPRYARMKLLLKRIVGRELWLRPEISPVLFQRNDWAVVSELLNRTQPIVYSFGIGDSIEFERLLLQEFNAEVYAFDPTPSVESWLRSTDLTDRFHFHPWAVSSSDGELEIHPRRRRDGSTMSGMYTCVRQAGVPRNNLTVVSRRFGTLATLMGHEDIDVLKMDIEGAEYDVLSDLIESPIRPVQILVEFHHRFDSIGIGQTARAISRLSHTGYRIVFVSGTGREVTFVYSPKDPPTWTRHPLGDSV